MFLCATVIAFAACGSDDDTVATSAVSGNPPHAEQLAATLDCETETNADSVFEDSRWPFTASVDCWTDGRPSIRIHTFEASLASDVARRFQQRYGGRGANHCPIGETSLQYVVVADTWAAVATGEALRDRIVDKLGGTVVGSDGVSPPVSYPLVDPCPESPPISAG